MALDRKNFSHLAGNFATKLGQMAGLSFDWLDKDISELINILEQAIKNTDQDMLITLMNVVNGNGANAQTIEELTADINSRIRTLKIIRDIQMEIASMTNFFRDLEKRLQPEED
ncbi:MAG: hypothetical protein WC310_02390 [Patescibacteria group bacterium]|jgi:TolA-binding protein